MFIHCAKCDKRLTKDLFKHSKRNYRPKEGGFYIDRADYFYIDERLNIKKSVCTTTKALIEQYKTNTIDCSCGNKLGTMFDNLYQYGEMQFIYDNIKFKYKG